MSAEPVLEVVRSLPHKLRVMRMYRYSLKELLNWSVTRSHWYPRAQALRMEFETNRHMTDREAIRRTVEHGEELLSRFTHWEPVKRPEVPGGTAYSVHPMADPNIKVLVNAETQEAHKKGDWM